MNCIDLMSKRSKMLSYVAKHSKQRKTTKLVKLQWIASIWCQNDQNKAKLQNWSNYNELHRFDVKTVKNRKTTKGTKLRSICIDLTSKRSKMLSYVAKHSKQRKTTKLIKLQLIASIWCQNDQNNAKLQNWSNYNELHRFDVKTVKNRKTTKEIKLRSICIDLTSKRSKMLSYVAKHSKQRKTTKLIKLQWIASIWCQNGQKSQNYKRNQITINLHQFDIKTIKNVEARRKTFKKTQNYKTDQITMNCIDLVSKRSKIAKLQKQSNSAQFASIWGQNDQNFEIRRKTTKVIKL